MILNNKRFNEQIDENVETAPDENSVSLDETEEHSQDDFLEMLVSTLIEQYINILNHPHSG